MSQPRPYTQRKPLTAVLAFAFLAPAWIAFAPTSQAQNVERSARAAWQPVRDLSVRQPANRPSAAKVRMVGHTNQNSRSGQYGEIAQTGGESTSVIVGSANPSSTVAQPMVTPASIPLDGQVVLDPVLDTGCDSLPLGSCGCGPGACDGACGVTMGGCDGIGCSGGVCCNGDPMCGEYQDCDSFRPCVTLCWPQDGWVSTEYLLWWQDGMALPPLASTGRLRNLPGNVLANGDPDPIANGVVVYGDRDELEDSTDGFRLDFGFWLNNCHTWGIGAGYFSLDDFTDSYAGGAETNPLVRPIITVSEASLPNELIEAGALVNAPALAHSGTLNINVRSELSGWDLYLRHLTGCDKGCVHTDPCCCPKQWCSRTEYRFGFRQVELNESIAIDSNVQVGQGGNAPLTFVLDESFRTFNQFNGVDFAWFHRRSIDYWTFDTHVRLGVGNTRQKVTIAGETVINGAQPAEQGGLLALNSNIGTYQRDEFAVLPQVDFKLGYQLTDQLRATLGYTFLYWSNVVRPGDQIERIVDQGQVPNGNAPVDEGIFPRFAFDNTDYWAQGLSFGLDYRW